MLDSVMRKPKHERICSQEAKLPGVWLHGALGSSQCPTSKQTDSLCQTISGSTLSSAWTRKIDRQ